MFLNIFLLFENLTFGNWRAEERDLGRSTDFTPFTLSFCVTRLLDKGFLFLGLMMST
jgi:hypothetical protein